MCFWCLQIRTKEGSDLQAVRLQDQQSSETSSASTYCREAVHLHTVLPILKNSWSPKVSHVTHSSGQKSLTCKDRGYSCARAATLRRNIRRHSEVKPFICIQCNHSCTTQSFLSEHVRLIYPGEKPYRYAQCKYSNLKAYMPL